MNKYLTVFQNGEVSIQLHDSIKKRKKKNKDVQESRKHSVNGGSNRSRARRRLSLLLQTFQESFRLKYSMQGMRLVEDFHTIFKELFP